MDLFCVLEQFFFATMSLTVRGKAGALGSGPGLWLAWLFRNAPAGAARLQILHGRTSRFRVQGDAGGHLLRPSGRRVGHAYRNL